MKSKLLLKYIGFSIVSIAILSPALAYAAVLFIGCSFVCAPQSLFFAFGLIILALSIIYAIGHFLFKFSFLQIILTAIVVPIIFSLFSNVFAIVYNLADLYLVKNSAVGSRDSITLHPGNIYALAESPDKVDELSIHAVVPFEVKTAVKSDRLPYMFSVVTTSEFFTVSNNPTCNNEFYTGFVKLSPDSPYVFSEKLKFIDPGDTTLASEIPQYDINTAYKLNFVGEQKKPFLLVPGKIYYIHSFALARIPSCKPSDFEITATAQTPFKVVNR